MSHILEEVGRIGADLAPLVRGPRQPRDDLDDEASLVLESMPRRGMMGPDSLAARAGVGIRTTLRELSTLELLGLVVNRDGGYALAPPPRRTGDNDSRPDRDLDWSARSGRDARSKLGCRVLRSTAWTVARRLDGFRRSHRP